MQPIWDTIDEYWLGMVFEDPMNRAPRPSSESSGSRESLVIVDGPRGPTLAIEDESRETTLAIEDQQREPILAIEDGPCEPTRAIENDHPATPVSGSSANAEAAAKAIRAELLRPGQWRIQYLFASSRATLVPKKICYR